MPTITFTHPDGSTTQIEGAPGDSVMNTAVRQGVNGIIGQCGGTLSCATCHVFLAEDLTAEYPDMDEMEDEMLDCAAVDREPTSRLSCQLDLREGLDLRMSLPEAQQ